MDPIQPTGGNDTTPPPFFPPIGAPQTQAMGDAIEPYQDPESFFLVTAGSFLTTPNSIDLNTYLKTLNETLENFRGQLRVATQIDLNQEAAYRGAVVAVVQDLSLLADLFEEIYQGGLEIVNDANTEIDAINPTIQNHNSQLPADAAQLEALQQSINDYNGALIAWRNCTQNCGPLQFIWEIAADAYNTQVAQYNAYQGPRNLLIDAYNNITGGYNAFAQTQNQLINNFNVSQQSVPGYIAIPLMAQTDPDTFPRLPDYATVPIGGSNPNLIPLLDPITPGELSAATTPVAAIPQLSFDNTIESLQQSLVTFLTPALTFANQLLAILEAQERFDPNDPLDTITDRLLPPAILKDENVELARSGEGSGASVGFAQQTSASKSNLILEGVVSNSLIQAIFRRQQLQVDKEFAGEFQLAVGSLFGRDLLRSIPIGLSVVSPQLASVTSNSPVFDAIFALSFSNRIQEIVGQSSLRGVIADVVNTSPRLNTLSEQQKRDLINDLTASTTASFLLLSTQLLGQTLGLPGLTNQLLATFGILSPGEQEGLGATTRNEDSRREDRSALQNRFQSRGFGASEAELLGTTAEARLNQGFATPLLLPLSSQTVRTDLLVNVLASGLVFKGFPADRATTLSQEALRNLFADGASYPSLASLRAGIDSALSAQGVPANTAREIGQAASIQSRLPDPLSETPVGSLSPEALLAIVGERVSTLLTPALGSTLTAQIQAEVTRSLAGTETVTTEEKSPFSLTGLLRDQRRADDKNEEIRKSEILYDAYRDKTTHTRELFEVSRQMLDPANIYLYMFSSAMNLGLEPKNWKKSLDIQV